MRLFRCCCDDRPADAGGADIDVASHSVPGEVDGVRDLVTSIAAVEADDGLVFDLGHITAESIRDEDQYAGVRVTMTARLATAVINFHVDINFGDPIWPAPQRVRLPRLLGGELLILGYPPVMIFAEKLVTAIERATANTRWRDFADIYLLSRAHTVTGSDLTRAVQTVADNRDIRVRPLRTVLSGFADVAGDRWTTWRDRQGLHALVPEDFGDVLATVCEFADPALDGDVAGRTWDPASLRWSPDR